MAATAVGKDVTPEDILQAHHGASAPSRSRLVETGAGITMVLGPDSAISSTLRTGLIFALALCLASHSA
jgi:hypothetical protein